MAEAIETAGTLPGGFATADDMYKALETAKADLTAHKVKASTVSALETELAALKSDAQKRKDAELTDLQKAQAEIAALKGDLSAKDQAIAKAGRDMLLERVLSKRLGTVPESHRELVRLAYERAASAEFTDEDTLNQLLAPVDKHVETLSGAPAGVKSGLNPVGSPGGKPNPQTSAETANLLKMNQGDILKQLRGKG